MADYRDWIILDKPDSAYGSARWITEDDNIQWEFVPQEPVVALEFPHG